MLELRGVVAAELDSEVERYRDAPARVLRVKMTEEKRQPLLQLVP
jgi:hypothetical protein